MRLLGWLAGLLFVGAVAVMCFGLILVYTDPYSEATSKPVFVAFYVSFFAILCSAFALAGWLVRRLARWGKVPMTMTQALHQLESSFRQGVLLSVVISIALFLQSRRILEWWNITGLAAIVITVEYWLTRR